MVGACAKRFYTPFAVFFGDWYTVGADGGLTPFAEKSRVVGESLGSKIGLFENSG